MAQVPNYQVPAHPSGLDMRVQLNAIVLALIGDNAGPSEPQQIFPGMWWGDTTAMRLRRRNNANDTWIDIGPLDDFLSDVRTLVTSTAANKVNKAGDFMTGSLFMRQVPIYWQNAAATANYGYISAFGTNPNAADSGIGVVDTTLTQWNFQVRNDGRSSVRNGLDIMNGGAVIYGRVQFRQPGSHGEFGMYSADGTVMFVRGRSGGGGMEFVNNDYNAIPFIFTNSGVLQFMLGGFINPDCNMWLPWRNQYLSDALGGIDNKADRYAQCPWVY
ncbi:hypothetical protein QF000_001704 [Paraburkholderia atlantica]|uniref:hypothetical protein n=1 Tax=Paraburkholderia atlantica TaxID=2654982 RepID=UPI003D1EA63B